MQGACAQAAPQRGQRGHAAAALAHRGQQRRRRCFRRPWAAAARRRLQRLPACGMQVKLLCLNIHCLKRAA